MMRQRISPFQARLHAVIGMIGALAFGLVLLAGAFFAKPVFGHDHHRHHASYRNWQSPKTDNCCNHQDCADLPASRYRQTAAGEFVEIAGQWCPVLAVHRLKRGSSPDMSVPHACIRVAPNPDDQCERLLCFVSGGGT